MTQYLGVDPTGRVRMGRGRLDNGAGPPTECPVPEDGEYGLLTFHLWDKQIVFTGPRPDDQLYWINGAPGWVDPRTIEEARATAIIDIDENADTARLAVVGDPIKVEEYKQALEQAQAFKDSGYTLNPVPEDVACWVSPTRTAQQSADGIIAKSLEWYAALTTIRSLRLRAKTAISLATTNSEVDTILATFKNTLTAAIQGVI